MGKFTSLACRGVQRRSLWQGQLITDQRWQPTCCQSLYGSPGASWQDKRNGTRCLHLVYLVCQICGYDTLSGMPDRGLKGAKAPSQVSKVSRQAITLETCKALIRHTKCVCKCALSLLRGCDKRKKEKVGSRGRVKGQYADRLRSGNP